MRKVFSFMKPYRLAAFVALLLMLIELGVELVQPFLISRIIDDGIMEGDLSVVLQWGGVMVGLSLVAFTAGIINSFYAAHVSQSTGHDIRKAIYTKVQSFSFSTFSLFPPSSLVTRMTNDITQLQNVIFMCLRIMLRAPLLVLGSITMIFIVNAQLGIIFAITVPILLIFLIGVMKKAGSLFKIVQERLDKVNNVMYESLAGIRVIKAFLRRTHEINRFIHASDELRAKVIKALRLTEIAMPVILLLINGSVLFVLWYGTIEVNAGGATVGEVVAIVNYAARMTGALSIFTMIIMMFSRARASASRVAEVLESEKNEVETGKDEPTEIGRGEIEFQQVSFRYPESRDSVLENLSFVIKGGEKAAILGATGSGKTSLFQLIPRLYEPEQGSVLIDGKDIRQMDSSLLRNNIGYVPQEALLFTGTIKENIAWGKENASLEEIKEAARKAQIHETILSLPHQYDTILGQKGVNLSGGQKQRLSIARALIRKPRILLLDDSTSALDVKTEMKLLQELDDLSCTVLMITQKISTTMEADTILLLDEGQLTAKGTHEELMSMSSLYYRINKSQAGKEA
ncbi:ABC transporter ATP-binding protein [Bacillus sp. FJAT-44742]|uniref:ABC transporter ATP-binding protein n=1 Tax=Bacillus sp. FJAT-44742 TaxID=2014005 RepID=UPI000C23857C|nr:ABC transporter ATP-binding protein [Bacillus sp. FJAT-44742]